MPWIKIINEKEASAQLKVIYENITKKRDKLSNIMRIHSLLPDTMQKHMDLYLSIMYRSSGLKRDVRELIAIIVSNINECVYCLDHHATALNHYWKDFEKINNILKDSQNIDLSIRDKEMINYVIKLTKTPWKIKKIDIEKLKSVDFSDQDILEINLIASYFNFVNRIALGLGVNSSKEESTGYKY
jgi:uncharacterized peroxidase-related enzyme